MSFLRGCYWYSLCSLENARTTALRTEARHWTISSAGWMQSFPPRSVYLIFIPILSYICRSQWPCGLRSGSTAARLLGLWVRIPPEAWMSVCCECCVLSGRGLCDRLITHPEESYRVWCVLSVIVKPRTMRRPRPPRGCGAIGKKNDHIFYV
jgi:hypothetical protein